MYRIFTLLSIIAMNMIFVDAKEIPAAFAVQGREAQPAGTVPKGWNLLPEQRDNKNHVRALSGEKKLHLYSLPYETEVYPWYVPAPGSVGKPALL